MLSLSALCRKVLLQSSVGNFRNRDNTNLQFREISSKGSLIVIYSTPAQVECLIKFEKRKIFSKLYISQSPYSVFAKNF